MPRLWAETIETHRHEVEGAILAATARLAAELGPAGVSMSQVSREAGIGRATLYKYFPNLDAILIAWHQRQVHSHLGELESICSADGDPEDRLRRVLTRYAEIVGDRPDMPVPMHAGPHVTRARAHLTQMIARLLREGAGEGRIRSDATPPELAAYCVRALEATRDIRTSAGRRRLVRVVVDGLRATDGGAVCARVLSTLATAERSREGPDSTFAPGNRWPSGAT